MENWKDKDYITWGIILVNIIYFLYLDLTGSSEDVAFMLKHGAMFVPAVLEGEYFRLLTAVFMHFGIQHLVNNMLILFIFGSFMEKAMGRLRYLFFYLGCGIGANLVQVGWYFLERGLGDSEVVVSAGASGAIFGIAGGLLYIVLRNRGRLERLKTRQMVLMIVISLYLGFRSAETNNLAHIAGVIVGFILAVFIYRKPKHP